MPPIMFSPSYSVLIGSLVSAVLLCAMLESRLSCRMSEKTNMRLMGAMLFACYGVCVGITSLLLSHFFELREWLSILLAVPVGIALLLLLVFLLG